MPVGHVSRKWLRRRYRSLVEYGVALLQSRVVPDLLAGNCMVSVRFKNGLPYHRIDVGLR